MRARSVLALLLTGLITLLVVAVGQPASAAPTSALGSGSSYVNLAMNQWKSQANAAGIQVQYTPTGSPAGMTLYKNGGSAFAGTEAEFPSLQVADADVTRGFQYVPDVAGATAIMYNLREKSGQKVDYLHLDAVTVARIFIGTITKWSDPAISASNKGIVFPDVPIKVVLRSGRSGTTALFFDFIASTLGQEYVTWFEGNGCGSARIRPVIIECSNPSSVNNRPTTVAFGDSQQIAQFVANDNNGQFSIAFDEFGYAKTEKVPTAWVRNAAGGYVLPYAENISAALESAALRPDLTQELSGVYASKNPKTYPISAYSYITLPCGQSPDRPTCRGAYPDPGQTQTMAAFLSYVSCAGQTSMATLGYSPLPPNLSQEMAKAVGRLTGQPAAALTATTCSNPRFAGSLGADAASPCDPFLPSCAAGVGSSGGAGPGAGGAGAAGGVASTRPGVSKAPGTGPAAAAPTAAVGAGVAGAGAAGGLAGSDTAAIGGGSEPGRWRKAFPVAFDAPRVRAEPGGWVLLLLIGAVLLPVLTGVGLRRWRASRAGGR